jgi:hypothetical protein
MSCAKGNLSARAAIFEQCATELGISVGLIPAFVDAGMLILDPSSPPTRKMVTRESLSMMLTKSGRGRRGRAS